MNNEPNTPHSNSKLSDESKRNYISHEASVINDSENIENIDNIATKKHGAKDNQTVGDKTQTSSSSIAGFPILAIQAIRGAQKLNKISILLIVLAIFTFVVFGTLASLKMFHLNRNIYLLFHYLPYLLVALTIPFTLYQAFLVYRYRLSQPSMLATSVGGAILLTLICLVFSLSSWLWLAMAAWIGVTYWFQATFKRFFKFIDAH